MHAEKTVTTIIIYIYRPRQYIRVCHRGRNYMVVIAVEKISFRCIITICPVSGFKFFTIICLEVDFVDFDFYYYYVYYAIRQHRQHYKHDKYIKITDT